MVYQNYFDSFMDNAYVQHIHWDIEGQYIEQIIVQPNTLPAIFLIPWNPYASSIPPLHDLSYDFSMQLYHQFYPPDSIVSHLANPAL